MIPERLLSATCMWMRPGTRTDAWGNTVVDWNAPVTTAITAWVTQTSGGEVVSGERDAAVGQWTMATNELDIGYRDRVEIDGVTYEVTGPPNIAARPSGPSHAVVHLTRTDG